MLDINREYQVLQNALHRFKKRTLSFETGCLTGVVSHIDLVGNHIEVYGRCGLEDTERCLMVITEAMQKNRDYKYWRQYHVLEYFG